jgi:hypothetical protein
MPARGLLKPGHHGGAGNCLACAHPDQDRLNADLVSGVPLFRLSKRYGINRESLRNHKTNHISKAQVALRVERNTAGVRQVADRVEEVIVRDDAMYEAARAVRNMPLAIKANNSKADHLELLARITGELDERPEVVVNIQQSAAFIAVRNVIFEELEDLPERRARISQRLRVLADTGIDKEAS